MYISLNDKIYPEKVSFSISVKKKKKKKKKKKRRKLCKANN